MRNFPRRSSQNYRCNPYRYVHIFSSFRPVQDFRFCLRSRRFQEYLQGFIQNGAVSFYQPVLANLILPHAVFFGYLVGALEMFVGAMPAAGDLGAAGVGTGRAAYVEPDARHLVGAWPRNASMALFWRGTRPSAVAVSIRHIFRRGCRAGVGTRRSSARGKSEMKDFS